jgi:hypothetical protein
MDDHEVIAGLTSARIATDARIGELQALRAKVDPDSGRIIGALIEGAQYDRRAIVRAIVLIQEMVITKRAQGGGLTSTRERDEEGR